ncbi:SLC13 family permease [Thalassotalea sp. PLHSN55]|uniref:SLC13 family permease n=1 Tax=Thalassotalea sp. PLHSN55 TaxID=3435888 RepID=UPI003F8693C8
MTTNSTVTQSPQNEDLRAPDQRALYQSIGLFLGPLIFIIMMFTNQFQTTMEPVAWRTAAIALWMAIWWATEAVPVPATAFLPVIAFPMLGITTAKAAASPYANPIIYLFLGAFILALAVERWQLHKRVALKILTHTGSDGKKLILGFMTVAALLSMWMTNTSTTMMLMPIALSVVTVIVDNVKTLTDEQKSSFQTAMLLGLAYSATIGGMATLVGTPPNALFAAYVSEHYGIEVSFAGWMAIGVPLMLIMLPIAWYGLTHVLYKVNIAQSSAVTEHLETLKSDLGQITAPEKRVAAVFLTVVALWILRRPLASMFDITFLTDAGIVMAGALALFVLPSGDKKQAQLMTWQHTQQLPWGVLILFGGGLSLASAFSSSGLATWLGESLSPLGSFGLIVLVLAATALVIFLTELTSNLATTATFLPVMAAIALQADIDPLLLCIPITLAASFAFMLPVATAPNAIVYASGKLNIPQMARAGFALNIIGLIIVTIIAIWWAPIVLIN